MSYQSLIVNAERIAVGSGLPQENIFGMIDHNTPKTPLMNPNPVWGNWENGENKMMGTYRNPIHSG